MSQIKKNYFNQKLPGSYSGLVAFWKARHKKQNLKEIQNELLKLHEYYAFLPAPKKFERRKVVSQFANVIYCADLIILPPKYYKINAPYKYIILFQDLFSKKIYGYGLRNKRPAEIILALKKFLKNLEKKPSYLQTDRGMCLLILH